MGAYSAAKDLGQVVRDLGGYPFHIQPRPTSHIADFFLKTFQPQQFEETFEFSGRPDDAETLAGQLPIPPDALVLGSGTGIPEYQYLAQASSSLGYPILTNDPILNPALIDKGHFYDRIQGLEGVYVPPYAVSVDPNELAIAGQKMVGPLLLKPASASGSTGGIVVDSEHVLEAAQALSQLRHSEWRNRRMILMPYLSGREFAVNLIIHPGRPIVTGVWKYERTRVEGAVNRYKSDWLMDPRKPLAGRLIAVAEKIAGRLGLKVGALHIELMLLPNGEIVPLDPNGRLPGGGHVPLETAATGRDPRQLYVLSFWKPWELRHQPRLYERKQFASALFLSTDGGKKFNATPLLQVEEKARALGVMIEFSPEYAHGQEMQRTKDADTVVGWYKVYGSDKGTVQQLTELIQKLDDTGAFELP